MWIRKSKNQKLLPDGFITEWVEDSKFRDIHEKMGGWEWVPDEDFGLLINKCRAELDSYYCRQYKQKCEDKNK